MPLNHTDVTDAINEDRLVVHYQPQIDLATGAVSGVEALARILVDGNLAGPGDFVTAADTRSIAADFTLAVTAKVLAGAADINRVHNCSTVSVNLLGHNLTDRSFPDRIAALLRQYNLPGSTLMFEITETSSVSDLRNAGQVLEGLTRLGCRLALDDFLTGNLGWDTFHRYNGWNEVKLDKSHVSTITTPDGARIISRIVSAASKRGCAVVAEGIEDSVTFTAAKAAGCTAAQGYHIARPMPYNRFLAWRNGC